MTSEPKADDQADYAEDLFALAGELGAAEWWQLLLRAADLHPAHTTIQ